MGHCITAIIIQGRYNNEKAIEYDLRGIQLCNNLTMFTIDIYYTAYWQHALALERHLSIMPPHDMLIPTEEAIAYIVKEIATAQTEYALIGTDYNAGVGKQFATILQGRKPLDPNIETINQALKHFEVIPRDGLDEFDTIELSQYRSNSPHLYKYAELCNELGL